MWNLFLVKLRTEDINSFTGIFQKLCKLYRSPYLKVHLWKSASLTREFKPCAEMTHYFRYKKFFSQWPTSFIKNTLSIHKLEGYKTKHFSILFASCFDEQLQSFTLGAWNKNVLAGNILKINKLGGRLLGIKEYWNQHVIFLRNIPSNWY